MKTKSMIFVFGAALMVSFGAFSSTKAFKVANAEDIGKVSITVNKSYSNSRNLYLLPTTEIALPDDPNTPYTPIGDESGVFINGEKNSGALTFKTYNGTKQFYFPVSPRAKTGTTLDIMGDWTATISGTTYNFTFEKLSLEYKNSSWELVTELDSYDAVSLADTCFDDRDREIFDNTALMPCAWNTFVPSIDNTRNSFAFSFSFEAYGNMVSELTIRVGSTGKYDEGHFYRLSLNNTWGPSGVIVFAEINDGAVFYRTKDLECNLQPGIRHTIEFASIYVLDSKDTFNYVKFDGTFLYQEIRTPASHERSTKVSYYYPGTNIFFGTTTHPQKENDQILRYSFLSEDKKGVYLDGSLNDIPSGWNVKGAPVTKNNALLNGEPIYRYGTESYPLTKCGADEEASYYLDLDLANISLKEGDVITLSDEYRFYEGDKAYSLNVIPISLLFSKNQLTQVKNIRTYLHDKIATSFNPEDYDEDKLIIISQLVSESETAINNAANMKQVWDLYHSYLEQIKEVPYKEEKYHEILQEAKLEAKAELNAYVDPNKYREAELVIVEGYVSNAIEEIDLDSTDTVTKVKQIVNDTVSQISTVKTKGQAIEEEILASDKLEDIVQYLEGYEVVTTTDLCASSDIIFGDNNKNTYHSGGYDDTTTRIATSSENAKGNMIFQFTYESDKPSGRVKDSRGNQFGAQIFIRMRGSDSNAYRFDIATITGDEDNAGVALTILKNDIALDRPEFNAHLQPNTPYKIECGTIDLKGYNRTLLFLNIDGQTKIKSIVDSIDDTRPTIAIRDSYTEEGHVTKMSPIEEGTTKDKYYSSLIGKLELDPSSNKDIIQATLRDNDIPLDTELYPVKAGSLKLNDKEINMIDSRPGASIRKTGANKYMVSILQHEYEDGDKVTIGGYFGGFNANTLVKSIYRLMETTFTYNATTDSWSQNVPSDEKIVEEAKETIRYYADLSKYSSDNAEQIEAIIDYYIEKIDHVPASEISITVPLLVDEAIKTIDVVNTILDDYKDNVISDLEHYRSLSDYRIEEQAELIQLLNDAYAQIRACSDVESIDIVVEDAKAKIDALKTKEQRDAEDLAEAKKAAYNAVNEFSGYIQLDRYSEENANELIRLTYAVVDEGIKNATSIEEVDRAVNTYKDAVKNIQTKDGTVFDGHSYIVPGSGGCGGSIETISMLSFVALFAAAVLIIVRKLKEN